MKRRWTYCDRCRVRLEAGEQVQQDDYPGVKFMRALRTPPVPARLELRQRHRGQLEPTDLVPCDHFSTPSKRAIIPLKTCLQRQAAKWPGKPAPLYGWCGSGRCKQGAEYRLRATYDAATDWASKSKAGKATFQFFRKDAGVQRQKQRVQALSRPIGEIPSIDRPPGARWSPEVDDVDDVREVLTAAGA